MILSAALPVFKYMPNPGGKGDVMATFCAYPSNYSTCQRQLCLQNSSYLVC